MIASTPYPWAVGLLGLMFIGYAVLGIRSYIRRYHRRPPASPPPPPPHSQQSPQG